MGRLDLNELKEEYQKEWGFSEEDSNYMIHYIRKLCNEYGAKTIMEDDSDEVFDTIKKETLNHMEYMGRNENDKNLIKMVDGLRSNCKIYDTSFHYVLFVFLCIHREFVLTKNKHPFIIEWKKRTPIFKWCK